MESPPGIEHGTMPTHANTRPTGGSVIHNSSKEIVQRNSVFSASEEGIPWLLKYLDRIKTYLGGNPK